MTLNRRLAPIVFFWIVPFLSILMIQRAIPHPITIIGLVVAWLVIGVSVFQREVNYAIIGVPFFVLLVANYWMSYLEYTSFYVMPVAAFVILMIPLTGLLSRLLNRQPINKSVVVYWLILGFLTAQVNSMLIFWPFSFFENTLISFIVYFAFWQMIQLFEGKTNRRSLVAHLVFVLLAVILVIGAVLWTNYPQFRSF